MLSDFLAVIGRSWYLDQKRNGTELILMFDGIWDETAQKMMLEFSETAHPMFRASSALETGELRSKGGRQKTIHFNDSEQNVELIPRTIISANQLSICGAVADMCREVSKDTMASEKLEAHDLLESMAIPTDPPTADPRTDEQRRAQKLSKLCSNAGLKNCRHLIQKDRVEWYILCCEYTLPRNDPRSRARGWIRKKTNIGPVLNVHVLSS